MGILDKVKKDKLQIALATIWFVISLPISRNLCDEWDDYGITTQIFALLLINSPYLIIRGWSWLTDGVELPRKIQIAFTALLALITFTGGAKNIEYIPILICLVFWLHIYLLNPQAVKIPKNAKNLIYRVERLLPKNYLKRFLSYFIFAVILSLIIGFISFVIGIITKSHYLAQLFASIIGTTVIPCTIILLLDTQSPINLGKRALKITTIIFFTFFLLWHSWLHFLFYTFLSQRLSIGLGIFDLDAIMQTINPLISILILCSLLPTAAKTKHFANPKGIKYFRVLMIIYLCSTLFLIFEELKISLIKPAYGADNFNEAIETEGKLDTAKLHTLLWGGSSENIEKDNDIEIPNIGGTYYSESGHAEITQDKNTYKIHLIDVSRSGNIGEFYGYGQQNGKVVIFSNPTVDKCEVVATWENSDKIFSTTEKNCSDLQGLSTSFVNTFHRDANAESNSYNPSGTQNFTNKLKKHKVKTNSEYISEAKIEEDSNHFVNTTILLSNFLVNLVFLIRIGYYYSNIARKIMVVFLLISIGTLFEESTVITLGLLMSMLPIAALLMVFSKKFDWSRLFPNELRKTLQNAKKGYWKGRDSKKKG